MFKMHRLLPITLVSAVAFVLIGSAIVSAQDGMGGGCPQRGYPLSNADAAGRECYERQVASDRAAVKPQHDVIDSFNKSNGKHESLPWKPLDTVSYTQIQSSDEELPSASHVAVARVVGLEFSGSDVADFPAMAVTYETVEPIKGFRRGERFTERVLGGPLRTDEGDNVFVTLPRRGIDRRGDLVLLFLAENPAGGYSNVNVTARFRVDNKGNIIDDENARALNLSGKPVADLIGELKAAAGN